MSENIKMAIGQNIAELRKLKDLTQRDFAEKLGVSQSHVARWETDKSQPRQKALDKIASVLGVTIDEVLSGNSGNLEKAINVKDQELLSLLRELQNLSDQELEALKTVIRGLLARSRIEQSLKM